MSNADRIRAMTNRELAEFLLVFDGERNVYNYIFASDSEFTLYNGCDSKEEAISKQLEWLESEVDNG